MAFLGWVTLIFDISPLSVSGSEAFVGLPNISTIYLMNTGLRRLESLQLALNSTGTTLLLVDNFIESVEPDTFRGRDICKKK